MKVIKVIGKRVSTLGNAERLYVSVQGIGRTYVQKELGLKDGDLLHGDVTVEERSYPNDASGKVRMAEDGVTPAPLVRWELTDYTSRNSVMEDAIMDAKIAALAKLEFKASDFFSAAPASSVGIGAI